MEMLEINLEALRELTLIESIGYIIQCSKMPAAAPAIMLVAVDGVGNCS